MLRPEPSNETLNQDEPYGWADKLRDSLNESDNGEPLAMHIVPRHSIVGKVLRSGSTECRSASHARGIVHKALKMGMPLDCTQKLDGTWIVFISNKGTDEIRRKHEVRVQRSSGPMDDLPLGKCISVLSDLTGLSKGEIVDLLKANNFHDAGNANRLVKSLYRKKKGRNR